MILKNYVVNNGKVKKEVKIGVFSDLHYSDNFNLKVLKEIVVQLGSTKLDYICIPGDIVDVTNVLDDENNRNELLSFFRELGKISPVFVSLGNHDYIRIINKKREEDINSFWSNEFKKLSKDNVYLLDNESYEDDNIRFIGYTLPPSYYYNNYGDEESIEVLIEDFNLNIKTIKDDKFNILLCHSPIKILSDKVVHECDCLKNVDMVISGHMHNGMIFGFLDNIFPRNRGLIAPNRSLYPDNARGIKEIIINNKKVVLIISGGISKIQKSAPWYLRFGNYFYDSQIEYIGLQSSRGDVYENK